jgi:hypothetical protein
MRRRMWFFSTASVSQFQPETCLEGFACSGQQVYVFYICWWAIACLLVVVIRDDVLQDACKYLLGLIKRELTGPLCRLVRSNK